jgi:N-acetylglutamate synthase-like GNAT family acetyltransferase
MSTQLQIDSNPKRLNFKFIHQFISNTYWAKGRSEACMQLCIEHSFNYGLYKDNLQIGYARVVSDLGQFAYLMDVFIDEKYRGNGFAITLMKHILNDKKFEQVKIWRLATTDAHGLYQKLGFTPLAKPEKMMELIR